MSFDLKSETWLTIFDPYGVLPATSRYVPPHPTFKSHTLVVGNRIFGLFQRRDCEYADICGSSSWDPCEDFFLRPNLAPDEQFLKNAYDVPMDFATGLPDWSQFLFAWDEDILCVGSYGSDMVTHAFELYNFAELSFFKITAESYQCPININTCIPLGSSDGREFSYAREKDHVNYFKAEFCGRTQLHIKTKKQFTHGTVCSCIFVDH